MSDFQKVTELNLNGTVLLSLIFGESMTEQKSVTIINYSSMAVNRAITRVARYSASKVDMENFTRWMVVKLVQKFGEGIRENAIAPRFFIENRIKPFAQIKMVHIPIAVKPSLEIHR